MSESRETEKDSSLVIQEIENQLEKLLAKKKDEIHDELTARIRAEEEAARVRMEGVEKDIDQERQSLQDFQVLVAEAESERQIALDEIQAGFSRALGLQSQIENLVKRTFEEIGKIRELQQKLESLRLRTSERAAFLKNDLKERFGIVADAGRKEELRREDAPDLDIELEKLKRIRTLLAGGTESLLGTENPPASEREDAWRTRIPEIQELIQATKPAEDARQEGSMPEPGAEDPAETLEHLRRIEPVAGSGEISYFQQGDRAILDAGRLLDALERAVDVARKLTEKLLGTESPKDRFFIKQELINGQEGLRNLVLRAASLCEKGSLGLPSAATDVIDAGVLRGLFERLSTGNWANADDLAAFAGEAKALRAAFLERTASSGLYALSVLDDLGGSRSVERSGLS
jgi:hypothetical protein